MTSPFLLFFLSFFLIFLFFSFVNSYSCSCFCFCSFLFPTIPPSFCSFLLVNSYSCSCFCFCSPFLLPTIPPPPPLLSSASTTTMLSAVFPSSSSPLLLPDRAARISSLALWRFSSKALTPLAAVRVLVPGAGAGRARASKQHVSIEVGCGPLSPPVSVTRAVSLHRHSELRRVTCVVLSSHHADHVVVSLGGLWLLRDG